MRTLTKHEARATAGGSDFVVEIDNGLDPAALPFLEYLAAVEADEDYAVELQAQTAYDNEYWGLVSDLLWLGTQWTGCPQCGTGTYTLWDAEAIADDWLGPRPEPETSWDEYYSEAYAELYEEATSSTEAVDVYADATGLFEIVEPPPLPPLPTTDLYQDPNGWGGATFQQQLEYLMQSAAFAAMMSYMQAQIDLNDATHNGLPTYITLIEDPGLNLARADGVLPGNSTAQGGVALQTGGANPFGGTAPHVLLYFDPTVGFQVPGGVMSNTMILAHEFHHIAALIFGTSLSLLDEEELATDFEQMVAQQLAALGLNEIGRVNYNDVTGYPNITNQFGGAGPPGPTLVVDSQGLLAAAYQAAAGVYGHVRVHFDLPDYGIQWN